MTENLVKWPSKLGQTDKIRPSDGCRRNTANLGWATWYEFNGFEGYLGNVGLWIIMSLSGCAVIPPLASAAGGAFTHYRISKVEEQVAPDRIDVLEQRVLELEKSFEEFQYGRAN